MRTASEPAYRICHPEWSEVEPKDPLRVCKERMGSRDLTRNDRGKRFTLYMVASVDSIAKRKGDHDG